MSYTIKSISSSNSKKKSLTDIHKKTTYMVYGFFAILLLIILSLFFSFNNDRHFQAFERNLERNDFSKAQIQLDAMESIIESKYAKYATNDKNSVATRKQHLQNFLKALDTLSSPDSVSNVEAVKDIKQFVRHLATISSSGFSTQGNRFRRRMMEIFPKFLSSFKKLRKKEIITPIVEKENQNRVYQQSILAQDLATEFGSLLGIAPEQLQGPSDRTKFYESGLLQGLPVLRNLPDNITELTTLKDALNKAGGSVSLRGDEKTPEKFIAKLDELREKCSVFARQINKLESSTGNKYEEVSKLSKEFNRQKNIFIKVSKLFMLEYFKTN